MATKANELWEIVMELAWYDVEEAYNNHIASPTYDSLKEYYASCTKYCNKLRRYKAAHKKQ